MSSLGYGPCVIWTWNWSSLSGMEWPLIFWPSRACEVSHRPGVEGTCRFPGEQLGVWTLCNWDLELV